MGLSFASWRAANHPRTHPGVRAVTNHYRVALACRRCPNPSIQDAAESMPPGACVPDSFRESPDPGFRDRQAGSPRPHAAQRRTGRERGGQADAEGMNQEPVDEDGA